MLKSFRKGVFETVKEMDLKSLPEKMSKMSEKDREKLAKKLDDELETYISSLEASASQPKYQVTIW